MNNCWNILAERAQHGTREAHARVVEARARIEKLESSEAHIDKLRADYVERYNTTQKESHKISDNIAYRQFLEHLRGLRLRVESQTSAARVQLIEAKAALLVAQREQAKMEAMVERDERNAEQVAAKKEQRELDAAGIRLFNLR
jgi:flagellar export protein FliJ